MYDRHFAIVRWIQVKCILVVIKKLEFSVAKMIIHYLYSVLKFLRITYVPTIAQISYHII